MISIKPHISEKSFTLASKGKYVFDVASRSSKPEIADTVEKLFKVKVKAVNIISIPGKMKRTRSGSGKRKDVYKAVVSLVKGDRIDLFEVEEEGEKSKNVKKTKGIEKAEAK